MLTFEMQIVFILVEIMKCVTNGSIENRFHI